MTFCSQCKQPCDVTRKCFGPETPADVELCRDRYAEVSACCEAELLSSDPRSDEWEAKYDDPLDTPGVPA